MEKWQLFTPWGIQIDGDGHAWHAGCLVDMLSLGGGEIVVAAETGGVWHIDGMYEARPLSDSWHFPDVVCLAHGPLRGGNILAGCHGGLYETDPSAHEPLRAWQPIPLPPGVEWVYRIVVLSEPARVVLATDAGVWWSRRVAGGGLSSRYSWRQALGLTANAFTGLALSESRGPNDTFSSSVIAGVRDGGTGSPGLFLGTWQGVDLSFGPGSVTGLKRGELDGLHNFSVASCQDRPRRVYAVAAAPDWTIGRVLRSDDGGSHWVPCSNHFESVALEDINSKDFSGDITAGGWQKTISVHPHNPDVVAFGWKKALLSVHGGNGWRALGGRWINPGEWQYNADMTLHDDVHSIFFDPSRDRRLYVLSDGGVAFTDDWALDPATFHSTPNRKLANLQFYCPGPPREFWGTVGSASFAPVAGGGLQDNGNVCATLDPEQGPWRKTTEGDGGWFACIGHGGGQFVSCATGPPPPPSVERASWVNNAPQGDGAIPMENRFGDFHSDGLLSSVGEVVPDPRFHNNKGTLYAVAAPAKMFAEDLLRPVPVSLEGRTKDALIDSRSIFGLFGASNNPYLHWSPITDLPSTAGVVRALGADRGDTIYIGTDRGELFVLDMPTGQLLQLKVDAPPTGLGPIDRIVVRGGRGPFALMESAPGSVLLVEEGLSFRPIKSSKPLPFVQLLGLDLHRKPGRITMAVTTDTDVWVSPDDGDTWELASGGLPLVPHCADVRFGHFDGRDVLVLGTWGRSLWSVPVDGEIAKGRGRLGDVIEERKRPVWDAEIVRNRFH